MKGDFDSDTVNRVPRLAAWVATTPTAPASWPRLNICSDSAARAYTPDPTRAGTVEPGDAQAARRRESLDVLPELQFISCASGAIATVVTYIKGEDVRAATERGIAAVEAVNLD